MKIDPNVLYDKVERYGTSGLLPETVDAVLDIIEKQIPKTPNAIRDPTTHILRLLLMCVVPICTDIRSIHKRA